jgi:hypothetical protein
MEAFTFFLEKEQIFMTRKYPFVKDMEAARDPFK